MSSETANKNFDPTTVPHYPVYRLERTEDGTVTADGTTIGDDADAPRRAVEHIAELIVEAELDAARVRAVTPDQEYQMAITADGTPHALPNDSSTLSTGPLLSRRRTAVALAALGGVLVVVLVAVIAITTLRQPAPIAATPPPPPPGAGSNLPVLAPAGYSQEAAYAIAIRSDSSPYVLPDGRIALTTDSGNLQVIDPESADILWKGVGAPKASEDLNYSTIDDRPVLATASTRHLVVWPLYLDTGEAVESASYDLPRSSSVSFIGSEPLVILPDQTVGFVTADGITQRDIPVTATPVMATSELIIAADDEHWYALHPDGAVDTADLPRPKGATGLERISAADDETLIAVWSTKRDSTDILTLVDLGSGEQIISKSISAKSTTDKDEPIRAIDGNTLTYGHVFIEYGDEHRIIDLGEFVPSSTTGSLVYGMQERQASSIDLDDKKPIAKPFTTRELPLEPIPPIAATKEMIWIVAAKVDDTYMYALPRLPDTAATPTPEQTPES